MIQVERLGVRQGQVELLQNISFTLQRGEAMAVVGPNGAGKTTLLQHVAGLRKPSSGCVFYNGQSIYQMDSRERARKMALLLQHTDVSFPFTAHEVVRMGRYPFLSRWRSESQRDRQIVRQVMEKTGTWHLRGRTLDTMSGGERQRVFLARALAQEPEILWLDEPTTYLDIFHQHEFLRLLREAQREMGLTWVAVLHDLNLAVQYCDRVILLDRGKLVSCGKTEEVLQDERLSEVYGVEVQKVQLEGLPFPQFVFLPRERKEGMKE